MDQLAAAMPAPNMSVDVADRLWASSPRNAIANHKKLPCCDKLIFNSYLTSNAMLHALRDQPASPRVRGSEGSVERPTYSKKVAMRDASRLRAPSLAPSTTTIPWTLCVWLQSLMRSSAWTSSCGCIIISNWGTNSASSSGRDMHTPYAHVFFDHYLTAQAAVS